jgi:hypothetical protein
LSDKIRPFKIEELKGYLLYPGDIFWQRKSGPIKIAHAGDPVKIQDLQKYTKAGNSLQIHWLINEKKVEQACNYINALKMKIFDHEKIKDREIIFEWFSRNFYDDKIESSLLELAVIGHKEFYDFEESFTAKCSDTSVELFRRCSVLASLNVLFAISFGFLDYDFLRDLYHVTYLFDYAFEKEGYSYSLLQASELERIAGQEGRNLLKVGAELTIFDQHPYASKSFAELDFYQIIINKSLFELIEKHHEKFDGRGFPAGINEHEMSLLESIIVFTAAAIPYDGEVFKQNDGRGYIRKTLSSMSSEMLSNSFKKQIDFLFARPKAAA